MLRLAETARPVFSERLGEDYEPEAPRAETEARGRSGPDRFALPCPAAFRYHARMADAQRKPSSPYLASRMIRFIGFPFAVIWLLYVLYADPTRGSINMAVSRTYLSLGGLFILLAVAFNAVATGVKILEERLKRLEETQTQAQNQGKTS